MSNPTVRVINAAPGTGCCPCDQQADCACSQFPCSVQCQAKSGIATLCGFAEYGTPSTPPKFYRTKTISTPTLTPFKICALLRASDCGDPTCPGRAHLSFTGTVPGIPGLVSGQGDIAWNSNPLATQSNYIASGISGTIGGSPATFTISISNGTSGSADMGNGSISIAFANGDILTAVLNAVYVTDFPIDSACLLSGVRPVDNVEDNWSFVDKYSVTTCGRSQTNLNQRYHNVSGNDWAPCSATPNNSDTFPGTDPSTVYGAGATTTVVDTVERDTVGNGCFSVGSFGYYTNYYSDRTIKEILSDEDMASDAIARENAGQSWVGSDCVNDPAFITAQSGANTFGYRSVQVQASIFDLIIGHTYEVTFYYYRRTCCGSGVFTLFGLGTLTFTAVATNEVTAFVDVPNDVGFETRLGGCGVVDVT